MGNFAGETNIRKAWIFVVIPAEAGIQDDLKKMESSLNNFGIISNRVGLIFLGFEGSKQKIKFFCGSTPYPGVKGRTR